MKQREDHAQPGKERHRPQDHLPSRLVPDIHERVHDPGNEVAQTQPVQLPRTQVGHVAGDHGCGEEADVVEMVLHCALGSQQAAFELRVERFLVADGGVVVSWVAEVHVVADCCVVLDSAPDSRGESQTPCQGDCVEGDVVVEKIWNVCCHGCLRDDVKSFQHLLSE